MEMPANSALRLLASRYEATEWLANGHFSVVYLCRERVNERVVIAKVVDRLTLVALLARTASTSTLMSEVHMLQQNIESGLLRLIDHFVTPHSIVLITEHCGGGSLLDHLLEVGPLTAAASRLAFRALVQAVAALHARSVIHRDIKPDNIFLRAPGMTADLVLGDFGLAREVVQPSSCTTCCGSLAYMSPEVVRCRLLRHVVIGYGTPADVWSSGVVLFTLITATLPWDEHNIFEEIQHAPVPFTDESWQSVPRGARTCVAQALCKEADERPMASEVLESSWLNTPMADGT